jgi:PAS domain S-box-containing protein
MAFGVAVLVGWQIDSPRLKAILPGHVAMNPATAVGFLCLAASLWLQRRESPGRLSWRWGQGFALAAVVLAANTLFVYLIGEGFRLDQWLFHAQLEQDVTPNRMAPNTALNFLLLGTSLLLMGSASRRMQWLSRVLALPAGFLAFLVALGYLYQAASFTRVGESFIPMALNTALAFLLVTGGILAARPDRGFITLICSDHLGGRMLRRLLPVLVTAPVLMGWFRLWAQPIWGYDASFGAGMLVAGIIAITTVLLWWNSGVLDRVEAALSDSEAKLRTLIDTSPDLITIRDREGRFLLANPAVARMMGRPLGEILGKRDSELLGAESVRRMREQDQLVIASESPAEYTIAICRPGGDERVYDSSKYPYYSAEGELIGVIAISRDVTERKQMEAELRLTQQRIRAVLENSPVFLFNVDREGRVLLAKGKGLQSLELNPTELTGHEITEAFHAFPAFAEAYRRALEGASFRAALDAGETSFDVWFTPLRGDEDGQVLGVIGVATDVSERKRLEAQLRAQYEKLKELDKLKGDFVNAVSHDLRTPLTSILGYAEFLEDEVGGSLSEQQKSFVAQIEKSSKRLEGMVNDLLDFARLDAGTFRLHCEEGDLVSRVRELVDSMRPQAEAHRQELLTELPERPIIRVLDPQRIDRVLSNLIGNALKFTPEKGRITVRLREEDAGTLCEVADTGIGIAPEDIPKLFQRFTQLAAGARMKAGTGLGLSISKAQVEAHGGTVGVRSEPGKGSTFWFRLPRGVPDQCRVDLPPPD